MRFKDLKGLTGLPIDRIRDQFRNEDVMTVLPAVSDSERYESLLVATPSALAIVTGEVGVHGERWMTRWAPWDVVHLHDAGGADIADDPDAELEALTVVVGGAELQTEAEDEVARRGLHDFVAATLTRRRVLVPNA